MRVLLLLSVALLSLSSAVAEAQAAAEQVTCKSDPWDPKASLRNRCSACAVEEARKKDFYMVCVDAFPGQREVVTLECKDRRGAPSCEEVGDVVNVNHDFIVYTWHAGSTDSVVNLGGTVGYALALHEAGLVAGGAKAADAKAKKLGLMKQAWTKSRKHVGPRREGAAPLTVQIMTRDTPPKEQLKVEHSYTVEAVYEMALRLGIGFSWAPWARRVGLKASPEGQTYVAVTEGADEGLFNSELVAGASYFVGGMPANRLVPRLAFGVRLGVISMQGSSTKVLSSLMIGPELAIGKDFSIGLFGGLVRHDPPAEGYEPGKVVPPGTTSIPTQFGVTPGIGLALNFTPGFLAGVGLK